MASPKRTILVTAATGNIGADLVPLLAKEPNTKLVLPTRDTSKLRAFHAADITASSSVVVEEGDISHPLWMQSVLVRHDVDTVFLCLGGGGHELGTTINILDVMARVKSAKQCVFVSICGDYVSPAGIEELSRECSAGHMLVKIPIEAKIKHGNLPFATTVLGPTLVFTNDRRSKKSLLTRGVFDEPVHRVSRVSTRDIAQVARNVMFPPSPGKYDGVKIMIGSRRVYSGAEIAGIWSEPLGKEVGICGRDPEALTRFEEEHVGSWGPGLARDVRLMYECFERMSFAMNEEEYRVLVEVLGREAEDYEGWVQETAKGWLEEQREESA